MKKRFIAYFDFLGYKDFVLKNSSDHLPHRVGQILRDIEHSLTLDETLPPIGSYVFADLSKSKVNVHFISDTVVFWTNQDTEEDFKNLFTVAWKFNNKVNYTNFPARGCLIYEDLAAAQGHTSFESGNSYTVAAPYGRGLVLAHMKAEAQSWAATVLDSTFIEKSKEFSCSEELLNNFCSKEMVPYKNSIDNQQTEYVFKLLEKMNPESFEHIKGFIERIFAMDNKSFIGNSRVQEIFNNTVALIHKNCYDKN